MIYKWLVGARADLTRLSAQACGERIEELRLERGGRLGPQDVLEDGRNEESPLHDAFTWDDAQAAQERRIEQARNLTRNIVVVLEDHPQKPETRAFVFVSRADEEHQTYTHITEALGNEQYRQELLGRIESELSSVRRRYSHFKEFAEVWGAIDKVLA